MAEVLSAVLVTIAAAVAVVLVYVGRRDASAIRQRAESEARDRSKQAQTAVEAAQQRRAELEQREERLAARESELAESERASTERARRLDDRLERVLEREGELERQTEAMAEEQRHALERLAGMTTVFARDELFNRLIDETRQKAAARIRRIEEDTTRVAERRAKDIVATAVQRVAVESSSQSTVTLVSLPSEDFKGRIIGREGRNIRTFEALTGVNLIIDDAPDLVLLSSFDPARREVAEVTLQNLLADGRIHPQRIETAYDEAVEAVKGRSLTIGYETCEMAGVHGLASDVVKTMGDLRLRTSFGQNVLLHMVETAQLAALMAAELELDVELARRGGFLHDIGKALTHELDGSHAHLGAEYLGTFGEPPELLNIVASHHGDVAPDTIEAVIVQAADACSAARPGARREEMDQYIERMDRLEALAANNPGVKRVFAMSAGREIRVMVEPEKLDDTGARQLAQSIAETIHREVSYPGPIEVTVIRELRASAIAN